MLKFWAALFMLLDHIGYYLEPSIPPELYVLLRAIGRLAFPIFAWSVARGYGHTRNQLRYFMRLLIFAVLSEAVIRAGYAMAGMTMHWTNVLFTFALSIAVISGYRLIAHCGRDLIASMRPIPAGPVGIQPPARFDVRVNIFGIELDARVGAFLGIILIISAMVTASMIRCDYDIYGLLTVLAFYIALEQRDEKLHARTAMLLLSLLNVLFFIQRLADGTPFSWAFLQNLSLLAVPIIFNAKPEPRPTVWAKYFFYIFYPLHIFLLLLIRTALN